MKNLEIKTVKNGRQPQYNQNFKSVTTFLRHSEDRIEVKNGEMVIVDIYENGKLIFSGYKSELFQVLKNNLTNECEHDFVPLDNDGRSKCRFCNEIEEN